MPPPTLIIMHPKERRSKCSVWPLHGTRDDLLFTKWPVEKIADRERYVRLAVDAPLISGDDADRGLLVLDATWRYAGRMALDYLDVEPRGLPRELRTAYPRSSRLFDDPDGGLATVEALYAALHLLGRETRGLLDHYHWRDEFLRLNEPVLSAPAT